MHPLPHFAVPGLAAPETISNFHHAGVASVNTDAIEPAGLIPQKESALAPQAEQSREQGDSLRIATPAGADKAFLTLRAVLALAGHSLSRTDASDGPRSYFVSRWGMVRELRDLGAVEAVAKQIEGTEHG